jgi:hypothetical protein
MAGTGMGDKVWANIYGMAQKPAEIQHLPRW